MNRRLLGLALGLAATAALAISPASGLAVKNAAAAGGGTVTCGSVITSPGQYFLTASCTGNGITIASSGVTVWLLGHTLTGTGSGYGIYSTYRRQAKVEGPGEISGFSIGVYFGGVINGEVRNVKSSANIVGFEIDYSYYTQLITDSALASFTNGFSLRGDSYAHLTGVTAVRNETNGISLNAGGNVQVSSSTLSFNSANGIALGGFAGADVLANNTADANGNAGIWVGNGSTDNQITGNTALQNTGVDLEDLNPGCGGNTWHSNRFGTAYPPSCIS